MPTEHAVAARADAIVLPPHDGDLSAIQLFEVPPHWPPAASAHPGGGPDPAIADLADPADGGQAWARQFAVLLAEVLAGARPPRQLRPWLSERGCVHLHRLLPLFADGHRPHVARVLTAEPAKDVVEMTLVVTAGPRTRALAVRLERSGPVPGPAWREKLVTQAPYSQAGAAAQWRCTDIEAA
jgi:hypothetical protein